MYDSSAVRTFQDALLHEVFWLWPALETFLEAVRAHVAFKFALVALQCRGGARIR